MELLILGLALGVGAAKRKEVTKAVVKGYMTVSEKTREVTAHLKEDMRDAVEEAQQRVHAAGRRADDGNIDRRKTCASMGPGRFGRAHAGPTTRADLR